jgi:ankyrin repeat protein
LVQRLIAAGADVNAANEYGSTPLSEAAIVGSAPIIKALLDAGADPKRLSAEGETALMVVARTGNVEAARLLLAAGADINVQEQWGGQSALMWAAAQSQPEMVKFLLENGANPDARGLERDWQRRILTEPRPKDMNRGGFTALLYAAREGCIECAQNLVEGGADIDLTDPERVSPLGLAINNLHFDLAAYLIGAGADVDKWDLFGRTPLYQAVDMHTLPTQGSGSMSAIPSLDKHSGFDIAKLLLDAGANPNIQLKRRPPYRNVPNDRGGDIILSVGATPLLRAARAGDTPTVKLLLEHGALVDLPTADGITPVMAVAGVSHNDRTTRGRFRNPEDEIATLELLVAAGADVNARMVMEPGARLLTTGERRSNFSYERRGRQVPSEQAVPHWTALHAAATKGWNHIIQFLADNGAELEAKDANGRTPRDLASGDYEARHLAGALTETVALLDKLVAEQRAATEPSVAREVGH